MPTADNYTTILSTSGASWWGAGVTNKPLFLTYSFNTAIQPYISPNSVMTETFLNSFTPLTEEDRTLARAALTNWAEASGITFFEVPGGQGDIQFGKLNFDLSDTFRGYGGFAQFPFGPGEYDYAGDVFISSISSVFTQSVWMYMHEIGHALGLKHPRDGTINLPTDMDNRSFTVMAERPGNPATDPLNTGQLSPIDRDAIQYIYGAPGSDGSQVASWSWDSVNYVLTQTGGANADTIRGVHVTDIIHGGAGNDLILGDAGNDELYGDEGDDRLYGGHGQDNLFGGDGKDTLYGEATANQIPGNDILRGGEGDDILYGERGIDEPGGADQLFGENGNDTLSGDGGDDRLEGGSGTNSIDGGGGNDTAAYALGFAAYTVQRKSDGTIAVSGNGLTDTLTSIEFLAFTDVTVNAAGLDMKPNDFNADGKGDILMQHVDGAVSAWLMDGIMPGSFSALGNTDPAWRVKDTGDFNGDGKNDIIWQNSGDGQARVWLMEGLGGVGSLMGAADPAWKVKSTGDFNGDGKSDIVWQNDDGQARVWLMNGLEGVGSLMGAADPAWHVEDTGDFNGDGKADIIWQNDSGQTRIWLMNGLEGVGTLIGAADPNWRVKDTGDFNGDGKADIFWQHTDGQARIWLMEGLGGVGTLIGAADPAWQGKATDDVNGDGKSDILWQNTDGQLRVWVMNGLEGTGSNIGTQGSSWHIVTG